MNSRIRKIVITSMLAALICVATMVIKIPLSFLNGYVNLGDGTVLLAGWMLSPVYGFFAAAIGSALADVFAGYLLYAPATFLIKGLMAVFAALIFKAMKDKSPRLVAWITGGVIAELFMVAGYYVYEGFLYGFIPSLVNLPANGAQALAGIIIGLVLGQLFEKHKIFHN